MEFLHSFLRCKLAGKTVLASQNVGYFLRLLMMKSRYSCKEYTFLPGTYMAGLWFGWGWWDVLNGKQALYGIGGSSALLNGNGGGSLGYALFGLGTRTGGKTTEDKNMPENVKLSWYFHSINQNRMLLSVHFTIHKNVRADWHYPSMWGGVGEGGGWGRGLSPPYSVPFPSSNLHGSLYSHQLSFNAHFY